MSEDISKQFDGMYCLLEDLGQRLETLEEAVAENAPKRKKQAKTPREIVVPEVVPEDLDGFTVAELRLAKATELMFKHKTNSKSPFANIDTSPAVIIDRGYKRALPAEVVEYLDIASRKGYTLSKLKPMLMREFTKWKEAQLAKA